jgi:septum formation protein
MNYGKSKQGKLLRVFGYSNEKTLILASVSPRRRELLAQLVPYFEVVDSRVDERVAESRQTPRQIAEHLANRKAASVALPLRTGVVLAADTVIDLDGAVLGKPATMADARRILNSLRGRVHLVVTAVSVWDAETTRSEVVSVVTEVRMRDYSNKELEEYLRSGEPMDKAGAYGIQSEECRLVDSIEGCYNNVVGLPLCEVSIRLRTFGVSINDGVIACTSPSGERCPRLA